MTEKSSIIAGLLGGITASFIGVILFWPGLYWINWVENYINGTPPPNYVPFYQIIGGILLFIPGGIGIILIIITWYMFGRKLPQLLENCQKVNVFLYWVIWSISVPALLSVILLIPEIISIIVRQRLTPQNMRDIIALLKRPVIWWILSGLIGSFTSIIYLKISWNNKVVTGK